ncbi:MAG: hypothetical protein ABWK01_07695, partial [Infirmifilum sp.]
MQKENIASPTRETTHLRDALLSFTIPLLVRAVPEVLSWPYPIGFDTLMYAGAALHGDYLKLGLPELLKRTSLFYLLDTYLTRATGDPILTVKLLGPLLTGLLGLAVYQYATRSLRMRSREALLASIVATTYFVALRISWEMYRQMLATAAYFLAAPLLKSRDPKSLALASLASIFIAWTHEFITVLLLATALAYTLEEKTLSPKPLAAAAPAAALFLYQVYDPTTHTLSIPLEEVPAPVSPPLAL